MIKRLVTQKRVRARGERKKGALTSQLYYKAQKQRGEKKVQKKKNQTVSVESDLRCCRRGYYPRRGSRGHMQRRAAASFGALTSLPPRCTCTHALTFAGGGCIIVLARVQFVGLFVLSLPRSLPSSTIRALRALCEVYYVHADIIMAPECAALRISGRLNLRLLL